MDDTIAAISTGLTESGIGVIRISGPESYEVAGKVLRNARGERLDLSGSHRVRHAYVVSGGRTNGGSCANEDGSAGDFSREILDEVLVVDMRGPRSYTGEDTIEIDCHGGVLMMKRVLAAVVAAGARLAEPGEFTKRAFLNGRMDLAEAEAVADIIAARSDSAIRASVSQLKGSVSAAVRRLRAGILEDSAYIEAALDDPEHYDLTGFSELLAEHTEESLREIGRLIDSFERGKLLREGVRTAIIGRPNAGKSSLLNAMLGEERAIVTDIPGTTRDTISECITSGGIGINLMDTAGVRESNDPIERLGVERTARAVGEADLILLVIDGSEALGSEDLEAAELAAGSAARVVVVLNKADLGDRVSLGEAASLVPGRKCEVVRICALNGDGVDRLFSLIEELFTAGDIASDGEAVITSMRHALLLCEARDALRRVLESIGAGLSEDFYTIDLMDAYRALGEIIGEEVGEDLINEIFSRFCMGK